MPIYEYQCKKCDNKIEVRQRINDDKLTYCENCSSDTLERLISLSSFRLMGAGWYKTSVRKSS
jgi:putative FmdB family regulatory protein